MRVVVVWSTLVDGTTGRTEVLSRVVVVVLVTAGSSTTVVHEVMTVAKSARAGTRSVSFFISYWMVSRTIRDKAIR